MLSGLYRAWTQKDEFFVLILGLDNAGKTTFLVRTRLFLYHIIWYTAAILINLTIDTLIQESAKAKFTRDYKAKNPSKITTTVGLNIGKIDTEGIR